jgi:hypothetical protein
MELVNTTISDGEYIMSSNFDKGKKYFFYRKDGRAIVIEDAKEKWLEMYKLCLFCSGGYPIAQIDKELEYEVQKPGNIVHYIIPKNPIINRETARITSVGNDSYTLEENEDVLIFARTRMGKRILKDRENYIESLYRIYVSCNINRGQILDKLQGDPEKFSSVKLSQDGRILCIELDSKLFSVSQDTSSEKKLIREIQIKKPNNY